MKYVALPVEVDAFVITKIEPRLGKMNSQLGEHELLYHELTIDDGLGAQSKVRADGPMLARMTPQIGDYWVVQSDGYTYLNPKAVFERKYTPKPH